MKISKLKYVFAFVLMVAVSMVTTNVKAATMPNNGQIKISTIIASQLAAIEDGDEPSASAYENEVYLFSSGFQTSDSALGAAKNPVYSYSIKNNSTGSYLKAYSVNYGTAASNNRDEVLFAGVGTGTALDNRIGLALSFSRAILSSADAADQTANSNYIKSASYATQMYIWMAQAGLIGTASETAIVNANLSGNALSEYYYISMSVNQALSNPSYTYATVNEANAHPIEMNWNALTGRYEYTVDDANGLDVVYGINLTVGANSGIEYSKNGTKITFYANEQVGSAKNPICIPIYKNVKNGRWVPGYANTASGERLVYLTDRQNADSVTYVSFYTNSLRVKVTKSLGTSSNTRTGDATVKGAVYGIYEDASCTRLVQEVTTDASGVAVSDPLELKDYYVKELTAPAGCKIDTAVKQARVNDAVTEANGQRTVTVTSKDDVIYGGFRMIVSVSDLSGNTTKDPAVGSKLKLTLDSNPSEYYETVVDEQGYADFTNIPYGQYTCTEIEKVRPELDYMDPMPIFINSEETYIYSKLVNTEVAQRYIKIEKRDAESGKLIPVEGTKFYIVDENGQRVVQSNMYGELAGVLDSFTTCEDGHVVLPEKLPYGEYRIYEETAPYGYYNESDTRKVPAATFNVESNTVEDPSKDMVVAVVSNMPQKANLVVRATGQILTGTTDENAGNLTISRPVFGGSPIPGIVYKITAKEDIKTLDGTVHMSAGQSVTLTTNANGEATAKLYLGSYTIEQIGGPEGYVINSAKEDLVLDYRNQNILEYQVNKAYTISEQSYDVTLTKVFEDLNFYRENPDDVRLEPQALEDAPYADVVVGIYAAEDIVNAKGEVKIAADTLIDIVTMNNDGKATLNSKLPTGKFYAKELATNDNYELSDAKYAINAIPANKTDKVFTIDVESIINVAKKVTKLTLTKIEEVEIEVEERTLLSRIEDFAEGVLEGLLGDVEKTTPVTRLEGAEYEVYYLGNSGKYFPLLEMVDGEKVPVVRTTDENGEIVLEGLPFGRYAVKETVAPKYYDLDEKSYVFDVTTAAPEAELVLQDARTRVNHTVEVIDEDGVVQADVRVLLVDPEVNVVAYETVTDEDGFADFVDIRAGRYVRVIEDLAPQYILPEDKETYLEDPDSVAVETVEVVYKKGTIVVYKTDAETAEPVPGCKFAITDELGNLVAEGESDENGYFTAKDLRYGVYYVEETEAAEGYELDATIFEVTIDEDGAVYEVDFTNVPTGDIAVAAYVMVALLSIGLIVRTTKKMKRN